MLLPSMSGELGLPSPWLLKDTVGTAFAATTIIMTIIAVVFFQKRADADQDVATLAEPVRDFSIDAVSYQELRAVAAARRAAATLMMRHHRRLSTAFLVISVFCGVVSSFPWLWISGAMSLIALIIYAAATEVVVPCEVQQRLNLLEIVREIRSLSLNGPFIWDRMISADIDLVFDTSIGDLHKLQRRLNEELKAAKLEHAAYLQNHQGQQ